MFEKQAEEYLQEKLEERKDKFVFELPKVYIEDVKQSFRDGAEFGYNKANEWHYVKDGLPTKDERCLVCNIFSNNYVATNIAEFNSRIRIFGCIDNSTIYAWKEIVLPKEVE